MCQMNFLVVVRVKCNTLSVVCIWHEKWMSNVQELLITFGFEHSSWFCRPSDAVELELLREGIDMRNHLERFFGQLRQELFTLSCTTRDPRQVIFFFAIVTHESRVRISSTISLQLTKVNEHKLRHNAMHTTLKPPCTQPTSLDVLVSSDWLNSM